MQINPDPQWHGLWPPPHNCDTILLQYYLQDTSSRIPHSTLGSLHLLHHLCIYTWLCVDTARRWPTLADCHTAHLTLGLLVNTTTPIWHHANWAIHVAERNQHGQNWIWCWALEILFLRMCYRSMKSPRMQSTPLRPPLDGLALIGVMFKSRLFMLQLGQKYLLFSRYFSGKEPSKSTPPTLLKPLITGILVETIMSVFPICFNISSLKWSDGCKQLSRHWYQMAALEIAYHFTDPTCTTHVTKRYSLPTLTKRHQKHMQVIVLQPYG